MDKLARAFPVFRAAKIAQRWAGLIDVTPDAVPVIGLGPRAGRLAADLSAGTAPIVDPAAFRFSRFSTARGSCP
ncbi:hypothetical protein [Fulvimarina sp. 2208YS6-2-32]|nr:hypothetical protein [Fulvimarina sp. 2208YS6-2-32]